MSSPKSTYEQLETRLAEAEAVIGAMRHDDEDAIDGCLNVLDMRVREALRESEGRYRRITDTITDFVFSCTRHASGGCALDWMAGAVERISGYSIEEIKSRGCWRCLVHELDVPLFDKNITSLGPGQSSDFELRIVHKDGTTRWLRVFARVLEDSKNQELHRLYGGFQDITERKRAEEALRQSEKRFHLAMEAAEEGLWDRHVPTNQVYRSPSFYTMLGYEPGEIPETVDGWIGFMHPDDRATAIRQADAILEPGADDYEAEYRFRAKDGQWRWLRSRGKVVERDADGRAVRTMGTHVDITDRKRAEAAVEAERRRLNDVLETLPVMVCLLTPDYHVPFANRRFREQFGESHGRRCFEYVFHRTEPCPDCQAFKPLKTHEPYHWEWAAPDGHYYDIYDFPFTDPDGSPRILEMDIDITERKRAEEELLFKTTLLEAQAEASLDGILVVNEEGKFTLTNRCFAEMWDLPQEVLDTRDDDRLLQHALGQLRDPEAFMAIVRKLYADKDKRSFDEIELKDGRVFDRYSTPLTSSDGKYYGRIWYFRDITDLRRSMQQQDVIRAISELFLTPASLKDIYQETARILCEGLGFAVGSVEYYDQAAGEMVFVGSRGNPAADLVDMRVPVARTVSGTVATTNKPVFDLNCGQRAEYLSGPFRPLNISTLVCVPITMDNRVWGTLALADQERRPDAIHLVSTLQSIANHLAQQIRRKNAEDALRKSEARFRQMAENIREVFLLGSPDWNEVLYVSPAYEGIWGRSHQSLYEQPRSWLDAVAKEDRDQVIAELNRRAAGDPAESRFPEFRVVRPDGTVRWVSARMFPIQNERGEVYRIAGICEDITERKRGEQMARQHEAELAHAWRISAMGEMTAGIAHELNQPLFSIMAYAEACRIRMQSGPANQDEVVQDLGRITAAAERAGSIIQRLRNFIRKREPKRSTFDVNTLIGEAMPFVEAQARERRVQVRLDAGPDMPTALGDSILIQQVILNLARNAIEAMEGVRAEDRRLVIQARPAGRDEVEVLVRDNGSGMSDELMRRLFEPFFTTKPAGLGLGLSISHSIIEANGGHLVAERNADRGMTFKFTLPVSKGGPNHGV